MRELLADKHNANACMSGSKEINASVFFWRNSTLICSENQWISWFQALSYSKDGWLFPWYICNDIHFTAVKNWIVQAL